MSDCFDHASDFYEACMDWGYWGYYEPSIRRSRTCKYCGLSGLHWGRKDNKWRLFNWKNELHVCISKEELYKRIGAV